jgi:hypothetical protein
VNDITRTIPRIYATLEYFQVHHQSIVVEVGGKIARQSLSILIGPRSSHNYIAPKFVEKCALEKCKHSKSWLV